VPLKLGPTAGLSFHPATPVMTMGVVLKSDSPRAIAARASVLSSSSSCFAGIHRSNRVKARRSNAAPVGLPPMGSLMPMKNGWRDNSAGPRRGP
jgi:hypothetical protein